MNGTFIRRMATKEKKLFEKRATQHRAELIREERRLYELEIRLRSIIDTKLLLEGHVHKCVYFPLEGNDGSKYVIGATYEEAGVSAVKMFGEDCICRFFQVGHPESPVILGALPGRRSWS